MRSLLLIGHGSHDGGESASSVSWYAELIRERGVYDDVLEGFWKEEPSLRQVLRSAASTDVTVVPLFISEGYFTETVIPRELGLGYQGSVPPGGIARVLGGRTVRYTRPYGAHPGMTDVILACARDALPDADASRTALVLVTHGAARNERSSQVMERNVAALRDSGPFPEVHALSLDDQEILRGWLKRIEAPRVVVVPFFAFEGWHTREVIPRQLHLSGDLTLVEGRAVHYARPVGTHPSVADVILHLAREASQGRDGDVDRTHQAAWQALLERARVGLRLGEVLVTPMHGVYEVRPALDEGIPAHELLTLVTPEGLREHTSVDAAGRHRPIHTLRGLRRGWRAVLTEVEFRRALHLLYPSVVEETYAHSCHALHATPWPTTARRQTGIYAKVQRATPDQVKHAARNVCAACLRTPLWAGERLNHTFLSGVPGGMPCAEACTFLIARIREEVGT